MINARFDNEVVAHQRVRGRCVFVSTHSKPNVQCHAAWRQVYCISLHEGSSEKTGFEAKSIEGFNFSKLRVELQSMIISHAVTTMVWSLLRSLGWMVTMKNMSSTLNGVVDIATASRSKAMEPTVGSMMRIILQAVATCHYVTTFF